MNKRYVYAFSEGDGKNKRLLGGKGANLCEMTQIGLNVPPGFVITTEACLEYLDHQVLPHELMEQVKETFRAIISSTVAEAGIRIGDLRLSVLSAEERRERDAFIRSAAEISEDF